MAIDLDIRTVEIKRQDRTREFTVVCPPDGHYQLLVYRHIIDKNTGTELSRELQPMVFTLAELLADPQCPALLAVIPGVLDRMVMARRDAIVAAGRP